MLSVEFNYVAINRDEGVPTLGNQFIDLGTSQSKSTGLISLRVDITMNFFIWYDDLKPHPFVGNRLTIGIAQYTFMRFLDLKRTNE